MKFFVASLLTILLSFISGLYIEFWWFFVVIAFGVALLVHQKPWKAFLSGFLALFLLWGSLSYWIDLKNDGILSAKIAVLLPLGGSSILLIIVTAFIGGLLAGLSALSGAYVRKVS
ncbi:MAG: hypothetical protein EPO57_02380 [Chitinophagaceae bacterium]|nr:MAG: hypothetical protein EPO57_02380 [Chitinophagaceae bacterium]